MKIVLKTLWVWSVKGILPSFRDYVCTAGNRDVSNDSGHLGPSLFRTDATLNWPTTYIKDKR